MKKRNNLRAAQQLERTGNYSNAISVLEQFLEANPEYREKEEIIIKIENLNNILSEKGDTEYQFSLKPLLEIPGNILRCIAGSILEYIFGWLLFLLVLGALYLVLW